MVLHPLARASVDTNKNPIKRQNRALILDCTFIFLRLKLAGSGEPASFVIVPVPGSAVVGDQSDSTNAIRSLRCAAVKALKLFLAAVA